MAPPRNTQASSGGSLESITGDDKKPAEKAAAPAAAPAPAGLPQLPTVRRHAATTLDEKSILLYGPPGIGKTTLASEFGNPFFFDVAGELGDLEVFAERVLGWEQFRQWGAAYVTNGHEFTGSVVDTADALAKLCQGDARKRLNIQHESDAEWGKGWDAVTTEWQLRVSKLLGLPGRGCILISHSDFEEVKTRSATYNRAIPTLGPKGVRNWTIDTMDLVLYVAWSDVDDVRVIHTKPSPYHVAKERSQVPRLPAEIPWPLGVRGIDVLREAWGE